MQESTSGGLDGILPENTLTFRHYILKEAAFSLCVLPMDRTNQEIFKGRI